MTGNSAESGLVLRACGHGLAGPTPPRPPCGRVPMGSPCVQPLTSGTDGVRSVGGTAEGEGPWTGLPGGRLPDLQGVVLTGDGGARKTPRTTPLRARVGPAGSLPAPGPQHRDPTLSIFTGPTRSPRVTPDTHALSPQGRAGPSTVLWGPKQELRTDLQGRRNPALHCADLPTFSSGPRIRQHLRRF